MINIIHNKDNSSLIINKDGKEITFTIEEIRKIIPSLNAIVEFDDTIIKLEVGDVLIDLESEREHLITKVHPFYVNIKSTKGVGSSSTTMMRDSIIKRLVLKTMTLIKANVK